MRPSLTSALILATVLLVAAGDHARANEPPRRPVDEVRTFRGVQAFYSLRSRFVVFLQSDSHCLEVAFQNPINDRKVEASVGNACSITRYNGRPYEGHFLPDPSTATRAVAGKVFCETPPREDQADGTDREVIVALEGVDFGERKPFAVPAARVKLDRNLGQPSADIPKFDKGAFYPGEQNVVVYFRVGNSYVLKATFPRPKDELRSLEVPVGEDCQVTLYSGPEARYAFPYLSGAASPPRPCGDYATTPALTGKITCANPPVLGKFARDHEITLTLNDVDFGDKKPISLPPTRMTVGVVPP